MEFTKLIFHCRCGQLATQYDEVGLSAFHELVLQWLCPTCNRKIYASVALSDCWRECPTHGSEPEEAHLYVADAGMDPPKSGNH